MKLYMILLVFIVNFCGSLATRNSNIINEYFTETIHQDCQTIVGEWAYNNTYDLQKFIQEERNLTENCEDQPDQSKIFVMKTNARMLYPSVCQPVLICNQTHCISYSSDALIFSAVVIVNEKCKLNWNALKDTEETFQRELSQVELYKTITESRCEKRTKLLETGLDFKGFFETIKETDTIKRDRCEKNWNDKFIYFEGLTPLPTECQRVVMCTSAHCILMPHVAMAYSEIFKKGSPTAESLWLPRSCKYPETHFTNESNSYTASTREGIQNYGLQNFNLPLHKYCGQGTNVELMDDLGGPENDLDNLCRNHDIASEQHENTNEADSKLLMGIKNIKHQFLPLFVAVYEAKSYYKQNYGAEYTSALYYFSNINDKFSSNTVESTVYNVAIQKDDRAINGIILEQRWKKMLRNIWMGYCIGKDIPNLSTMTLGNGQCTPGPSSSCQSIPGVSPPCANDQSFFSSGDQSSLVTTKEYPKIPNAYNCRLVISEVDIKQTSATSFIELKRVCPPNKRSQAKSLIGYHLLILRVKDLNSIYLSYSLGNQNTREIRELVPPNRVPNKYQYYVLGSSDVNPDTDFNQVQYMVTPNDNIRGVPYDEADTFAIVLLHFPTTEEAKLHADSLAMWQHIQNSRFNIETYMGDLQFNIIQKYVQDLLLYGAPCPLERCRDFLRMIPNQEQVQSVNDRFIPLPYPRHPDGDDSTVEISLNRCTSETLPMQHNDFIEAEATPGFKNNCPEIPRENDQFNMQGISLQSSAQKLIVNCKIYFDKFRLEHGMPQSSVRLTSQACSISETTIRKVITNWKTGNIVTPGKKRNNPFKKQGQIDKFYSDGIKGIIQGYYSNNQAPFLADIFKDFKDMVKANEELRRGQGETIVPFTLSEKTFRRILHKLGFKFGKIELRDVILMRPDIVKWRGEYIYELRKNRAQEKPLKVIYLDETWIDPHGRTGKGWVPSKCSNYRERAKYSFKRHKISGGPRIIVLNAGGDDGMFHPAMKVFAVHKTDVTGDYHDNMNSEAYTEWFGNLIKELDKTGEKYLIVQDNAPYHSATDVPKFANRKAVMYEWLDKHLPQADKVNFKRIQSYKKIELWGMIKGMKATKNYYTIDKMALDSGHKVLRLPPYNCDLNPIELVWKDVKDAVRKGNRDQNVASVIALAEKTMLEYKKEIWQAHVRHARRLEEQYWEQDGFYDEFLELNHQRIVISTNDDDSDSDDDDEVHGCEEVNEDILRSDVHEMDDDDELLDI